MTDLPSKCSLSVRQLAKLLKKFHIQNGDIIALKHQSENANYAAIDAIKEGIERMKLENVLIIVVDNFNDMSVLNETEMNKHGWYRIEKILKRSFQKNEQ